MGRKLRDYGSSRYVQKDDVTRVTREVRAIGQKITHLISVMALNGMPAQLIGDLMARGAPADDENRLHAHVDDSLKQWSCQRRDSAAKAGPA